MRDKVNKYLNIFFALILISTITTVGYFINFYYATELATEKTIIIPKQAKISTISSILYKEDIIPESFTFKLIAFLNMKNGKFLQPGEYYFPSGSNVKYVFEKISNGDRVVRKITIPEGYTNYQILELLRKNEVLDGEIPSGIQEGQLLPETYTFYYGDTKKSIVSQMQAAQTKFIDTALSNATDSYLKSQNEVMILASIIEKEARISAERPAIASVYLNRLKIGMPLQADPTVIYALKNGQTDFNYILSRNDLTIDSPFNTYKYKGLPPSPICNPGKASIMAALYPATTNHLFFVADGETGGHLFSQDYKTHLKNISQVKSKS